MNAYWTSATCVARSGRGSVASWRRRRTPACAARRRVPSRAGSGRRRRTCASTSAGTGRPASSRAKKTRSTSRPVWCERCQALGPPNRGDRSATASVAPGQVAGERPDRPRRSARPARRCRRRGRAAPRSAAPGSPAPRSAARRLEQRAGVRRPVRHAAVVAEDLPAGAAGDGDGDGDRGRADRPRRGDARTAAAPHLAILTRAPRARQRHQRRRDAPGDHELDPAVGSAARLAPVGLHRSRLAEPDRLEPPAIDPAAAEEFGDRLGAQARSASSPRPRRDGRCAPRCGAW